MPTFKLDLPDGSSYTVDASDEQQLQSIVTRLSGGELHKPRMAAWETDPNSQEWQAKYGPVADMGTGERLLSGAGKAFSDLWLGAKQLDATATRAAESINPFRPKVADQMMAALHQEAADRAERDAALMTTPAGITGNVVGNVTAAIPAAFVPGANTYAGTAAVSGLMGALQPVTRERDRLINTGVGAAAGVATKYGLDRLSGALSQRAANQAQARAGATASATSEASSSGGGAAQETLIQAQPTIRGGGGGGGFGSVGDDVSSLTSAQQQILQDAKRLGFRATPGQASGSRALQQMEAKLESQPMTSGPLNKLKIENARVLNRTVARAIGVDDASVVDSATLDQAFRNASKVFDSVADDLPHEINPKQFVETYTTIKDELEGLYEGFGAHPLVKRLVNLAENGSATGEQLQSLSSKLTRAAYKNMSTPSGDRDLGIALYRVKDYVDDLLQQGMKPAELEAFAAARSNYRNLMLITSRVGIVNPSSGNVSGANLANALQMRDRLGFLRGANQSDMYTAARFAQAFKPLVGDSGTATRSMVMSPTDWVVSLPFNVATRAYVSAPTVRAVAGAKAASNALGTATRNALLSASPTLQAVGPPIAGSAAATVSANALRNRERR